MSKEIYLFSKDDISIKDRFYLLMNLLISNQTNSRLDSILFLGIFFLQIITGFFSDDIGVFNKQRSTSDKILNYIVRIIRLKDLFIGSYITYKYCLYIILCVIVLFTIFLIYVCTDTNKVSFYTYREALLNFYIKTYIYIGFNIILDMVFSSVCFEQSGQNPYWPEASCKIKEILPVFLVSIILLLWSVFFVFFIQFFYCDSLYLSTSFYAKISCNYEILSSLNGIFFSISLNQAKYLGKEVFLLYNLASSCFLFYFYIKRYLFYDRITNMIAGMFHALYAWTSLFFLIFAYVNVSEKGIIYLASSCIVLYFYFNIKFKVEENILLSTPFYQIKNQYYILYYIKNLIDKINHFEESPKEKALLTGIMQMHAVECPNPTCVSKLKDAIYLPLTNEWSDRSKPLIADKVYLMNFIILVMNFFIGHNYYSPNMVINMSLYFLEIIGNFCQAMFYYKKVKEMKLSIQEHFSFIRLKHKISQALVEKLKAANEVCYSLEDLNVTMYFKYEDLSKTFFDEMNNDVNLSLDFWKTFRNCQIDVNQSIDFNKIFHLTDRIRITKEKVEKLWGKLIKIFNGVNELFELYLQYVEQINDDDLLKRDLEEVKRKNENFADHIQQNFYNMLFSKETGIIIANGDKGKEGLIEKANSEIEAIFRYKPEEIKGMNLSNLMPKLFAKNHKTFIEKYYDFGEKKVMDKKDFKTFGKDKENSIVMLKLAIKLFPMLNECVYFVGLIIKENIDDIIFIDSKFNIQGMSIKLMRILQLQNKLLFQDNEIPFYVICKKFVNFYKIFLQGKKQGIKDVMRNTNNNDSLLIDNDDNNNNNNQNDNEQGGDGNVQGQNGNSNNNNNQRNAEKNDFHENVEINENIELEYEIRLPKFLIDYSNTIAQREQKSNNNLFKSNSEITDNHNDGEEDELIGESAKEGGNALNKSTTPGETPQDTLTGIGNKKNTLTPAAPRFNKDLKITIEGEESEKIDFNKPDEEKEFISKVTKYRELFENGQFNELEDFIDQCTKNSPGNEFKFNFTFDRYKYGERQMAYIVRCIDNKNELGKLDDDSVAGDANCFMKSAKYKKEKADALKNIIELYDEEKHFILTQQENFISLSLEDKHFQNLLQQCKDDINKLSIIHGQKKEALVEDENSSQTSTASFNADLCRKNRIEEIRSNIMKNVSTFYTLKYIKSLVIFVILITCVFCSLYLIFFNWLFDDLMNVCSLNSQIYQTTIWISNIVSVLISLRTYYRFVYNNETGYNFNSYIEDKREYFETLKQYGFDWYNQTIKTFGLIENEIERYITQDDSSFWGRHSVLYISVDIPDKEGFPLGLGQVLSDINSLLRNVNFTHEAPHLDTKHQNYINYIAFLSIENAYENLLPIQFNKLHSIPQIFRDFNKKSIHILLGALLVYSSIIVVFCIIYDIFLYITNKNMGAGLLKVTKIKLEKIEDTLKRIETFNGLLRKYRDKDNNKYQQYDENGKRREAETAAVATTAQSAASLAFDTNVSSAGFGGDNKKHKELKILTYSYYQTFIMFVILCAMLIPMYVVTNQMVYSSNQLIDVENFLFGKILISSASTVKVKCMMSQCEISNELNYDNLVNKSDLQNIVQGISLFSELNSFYNDKFLANACATAFDPQRNSQQYEECMNEVLVQSANNTDSLLRLIDETIENIYKEEAMQRNESVVLSNGTTIPFNPLVLFNSGSFSEMESVFYKYVAPTTVRLSEVFQSSLKDFLKKKRIIVVILISLFGIIIFAICFFIVFIFIKKLVHLLSVSRCIFRIIPTTVISSTQDLVNWIETYS
jgi:PAS domain S-box-containing protein